MLPQVRGGRWHEKRARPGSSILLRQRLLTFSGYGVQPEVDHVS